LHDLRHGAATLAHSSIVLTADTYTSVLPAAQYQAAEATRPAGARCRPHQPNKIAIGARSCWWEPMFLFPPSHTARKPTSLKTHTSSGRVWMRRSRRIATQLRSATIGIHRDVDGSRGESLAGCDDRCRWHRRGCVHAACPDL